MNKTLGRLETCRTKTNTTFRAWWPLFNKALAAHGLSEAGFADAQGCYEMGESPETAASYLANS
jgi:hypothetical protein